MTKIDSPANAKYKMWLSLTTSKGINKNNAYILSGKKLIKEAIESNREILAYLGKEEKEEVKNYFTLNKDLLKELSPNQQAEDILIIKKPSLLEWSLDQDFPNNTLLVPTGDPSNLGAILRSALAFNYTNIILLKEAANPFLAKAVKASSGAIFYLNLYSGPSIQDLKSRANEIQALDTKGNELSSANKEAPLLVGEEGPGLPDYPWQKFKIPMNPYVESLNAASALAIAMYEISKK